ncbi:hypothetical protein HN51_062264 [Arachis hypogaea]
MLLACDFCRCSGMVVAEVEDEKTSPARAIPLSAIPLPAHSPPLNFFSLLSTLSPSSSLWLTSLTAGLAVDPSLSGFTLLSRLFRTQARRALSPLSQALSRSVTIASSSSCVGRQRFLRHELVLGRNWEDEIELDGEVIELSYHGSYPWWQLLRGSVERSPARASLLYLPLFLVFTTMAFILFTEENVDIAVVEAGLGGARDATNVISSVRVSSMKTAKPTVNGIEKKSGVLGVTGYSRATWLEIRASLNEHFGSCREISRVSVPKDFESGGPKCLRMRTCSIYFLLMMMKSSAFKYHVDAEAYTYDDEVIKKAEAMGKPENPKEATVETTRAIKHHQES